MADELPPEDGFATADPLVPEAIAQETAFVLPAMAYDAIDTEAEITRTGEPQALPPEPADSAVLPAIEALGETLHRRLETLQTLFEREIRAESTREKVVDRLHAELQEYKQDLLLNMLRPIFVDLIQLHDDIGKITESQGDGAEGEAGRLLGLMRGFQQGIEDILYRQGVEPYVQEGEAFDPRRQRAVATVPTEDVERNKRIAARHRKGFQAGDKVIRAEIVSVYALKK